MTPPHSDQVRGGHGSSPTSRCQGAAARSDRRLRGAVTLTGTRACLPANKEECKNGGWRNFGVFKNQGDCVSFVATGGKNPPSGS